MHQDFKDLLSEFNAHGVEYLVVGAHALAAHGHVRATKDMDVWVRPTRDNAQRVMSALAAFGAPAHGASIEDFSGPDFVLQIGVQPIRIDVLTSITGVTFDEAWPARLRATFDGAPVGVLSKEHLIQNKSATGRPQDLADVDFLTKA
ncbi:MAG TPA: nucleotidyltransferase [Polyangiales bacterium]|nr:nucleotidyltransferase [Polyangiales bacterium]